MPEMRHNVATREWVIIATERARRPHDFVHAGREVTSSRPAHLHDCPFCPGNEGRSGEPTLVIREGEGWAVRVVPNKYPALSDKGDLVRTFKGVERRMSGFGVHEVVVESPRHDLTTALQSEAEVARTLDAYRRRARELASDPRVVLTTYFKNHGAAAGTSLEHPHSQMISMPVVPHNVRNRLLDAQAYYDENGRCVFCDMCREELDSGARIIVDSRHFVSFIPYAAFSPFHTWILPKHHMALFTQLRDQELEDLAHVLRQTLARLYHGLRDPDFNYVIRTAPNHDAGSVSFHWYLSIVPKVGEMAGFEMGSGMFINTALPEESARFLRDVVLP